ncbi:MAG: 4Fe-4S binding protein [Clostridiales bacterium]
MKVAVLSGKGGTGKTFVAVNLAAVAEKATYIDCDVEEPNGRLFFKPQNTITQAVTTLLPRFDVEKCTGCRTCVTRCRFNALVLVKGRPLLFPEICHSCGGCVLFCPERAITESVKQVGTVEWGESGNVRVVTGMMKVGEASGIPLIKAALAQAGEAESLTVIDCPPGSACSVMESVEQADYCILVAEPTAFGVHNLAMVHELVGLLHKPCGLVINKADIPYPPLADFCEIHGVNVLSCIPYREDTALFCAKAQIAALQNEEIAVLFQRLLREVRKEAAI